jgi:RNA polymerase sigma-70 factor, ECF subfamily
MEDNHNDLVLMIIKGDEKAFSTLYKTYYQRVYNFTWSYIKDEFVSANLVHDAFLTVWENREKLDKESNLPAYLLVIVKNKSLNYLSRQATKARIEQKLQEQSVKEIELRISGLNACNPHELFSKDVENIIKTTIESLPYQCRNVFYMSRYNGMGNKDISSELGISLKAVEYHITKALRFLKQNLKDYLTLVLIFF